MAILYSVVAKKTVILCRYAACIGNFGEITDLVLSKLDTSVDTKMTYQSGPYSYHYIIESGIVFLCISDQDFDRGVAFKFLSLLKSKFVQEFGPLGQPGSKADTNIPYSLNAEFGSIISQEMNSANNENGSKSQPKSDDKVERLRNEVQQVKDIMVANIDSIIDRGERLELLVDKTENLSNESVSFRRATRRVERQMWWQNAKMKVVLVVVSILVLYGIVSASCGGLLWPKCVGKK